MSVRKVHQGGTGNKTSNSCLVQPTHVNQVTLLLPFSKQRREARAPNDGQGGPNVDDQQGCFPRIFSKGRLSFEDCERPRVTLASSCKHQWSGRHSATATFIAGTSKERVIKNQGGPTRATNEATLRVPQLIASAPQTRQKGDLRGQQEPRQSRR